MKWVYYTESFRTKSYAKEEKDSPERRLSGTQLIDKLAEAYINTGNTNTPECWGYKRALGLLHLKGGHGLGTRSSRYPPDSRYYYIWESMTLRNQTYFKAILEELKKERIGLCLQVVESASATEPVSLGLTSSPFDSLLHIGICFDKGDLKLYSLSTPPFSPEKKSEQVYVKISVSEHYPEHLCPGEDLYIIDNALIMSEEEILEKREIDLALARRALWIPFNGYSYTDSDLDTPDMTTSFIQYVFDMYATELDIAKYTLFQFAAQGESSFS